MFPDGQRKAAEAGTIALSIFVGGMLVDLTTDVLLVCLFAALPGFFFARRVTRTLQG